MLESLWRDILIGDARAWRKLVSLYSGLTYAVARRCGLTDPDAEDCVQHTWLTLYRRRYSIRDPQALPAWLIRTTYREARQMAERLSRPLPDETPTTFKGKGELPEDALLQLELEEMIKAGIELLDTRCQRLLQDLFLSPEPKSYKDVARALNMQPNALGPLRSRCLEKLRKILRELGYEAD